MADRRKKDAKPTAPKKKKELQPTGIDEIDSLATLEPCSIGDYIRAVSAYVREVGRLDAGRKKSAQIRLSSGLGRALATDLQNACSQIKDLQVGERKVSGALRTANADVIEPHPLDGLRLAVELKPVNLAVGRALWNRFGDLRTFAVNIHLKFPFTVVGGVLVVPTYEEVGSAAAKKAEKVEEAAADGEAPLDILNEAEDEGDADIETEARSQPSVRRKSTEHLIQRAVQRLIRAGGRKNEGDAPHLLEAISVVAYDPEKAVINPTLPHVGSRLRWEEFIEDLAAAYRGRFEQ